MSAHLLPKRVRGFFDPLPQNGSPYLADCRSFDIPETIAAMITQASPGLVAVTLSRRGGPKMMDAAENAASSRGAKILWWNGPDDPTDAARLEYAIEIFCASPIETE